MNPFTDAPDETSDSPLRALPGNGAAVSPGSAPAGTLSGIVRSPVTAFGRPGKFLTVVTAAVFAAILPLRADDLREKARAGDTESQFRLASEYFFARNRAGNLPLAVHWFRRAAAAGHAQAQYNLAQCYLHGWGCETNLPAAYRLFDRARQAGVRRAAIQCAEMLFHGVEAGEDGDEALPEVKPDREKALDILRRHADESSPDALLLLAQYLYMEPEKHGRELRQLLARYVAAAPSPTPEALVIYAACLRSGIGGELPDAEAGAEVLRRAAEMKHPEAMAQLAEILYGGFGVKADRPRAMNLWEEAVKLGSSRAMFDLARFKLAGVETAHDPAGAFALLTRAAELKFPPAIRQLGSCFESGIGTAKDPRRAMELYLAAAEAGDAPAAFRLGECFRDGVNIGKNPVAAFHFFRLAAKGGHAAAMREAAKAMIDGKGTAPDRTKGLALMRRAAEAGDEEAAASLSE